MAYADDFYDSGNFGYDGPHGTGVLFLIDMDNREIYISTCGDSIYYLTDARIETILDAAFDYVSNGQYYDAAKKFLSLAVTYMQRDPYAKPTFMERVKKSATHIPRYLIFATLIGLVYAWIISRQQKAKDTTNYTTYQATQKLNLVQHEDIFLRLTVSDSKVRFAYSTDQKRQHFTDCGDVFPMKEGKWIGAKFGFIAAETDPKCDRGWIDVDWIRVTD